MTFSRQLLLAVAGLLWTPLAWSQGTLGALLDAGAKPVSPAQFKQELVLRTIGGQTFAGGSIETMYLSNGTLVGSGDAGVIALPRKSVLTFEGEWSIDASGRICSSLRQSAGGVTAVLPPRCQFWFKLGDKYFLSDSDTDRSAKVLSRTIKQ